MFARLKDIRSYGFAGGKWYQRATSFGCLYQKIHSADVEMAAGPTCSYVVTTRHDSHVNLMELHRLLPRLNYQFIHMYKASKSVYGNGNCLSMV